MAIRNYNPTTPGLRGMSSQDFSEITTRKPVKSLLRIKKITSGRNNQGRITTRHKGGGVKNYYRLVNYQLAEGTTATVEHIEYDPNRSARIARIKDQTGKYHYVIAPKNLKVGTTISSDAEVSIEVGNRTKLRSIPVGTVIHAVELQPGKGAQLARGAGTSAQLLSLEEDYAQVRLPSGEVRLIHADCTASIGVIGNEQHQNIKYGKAGRRRLMGVRPTVRGIAMNAVDHPHGGGEGRGKGGGDPRTPWGQRTLGYKTRSRKANNKFIVRSRHEGRRK